jgi:hypothetical protein
MIVAYRNTAFCKKNKHSTVVKSSVGVTRHASYFGVAVNRPVVQSGVAANKHLHVTARRSVLT